MNNRARQAEKTKAKIVAAAFQVVKTEGVQRLSVGRIIKAIDISKGGFFHHFSQIEDLYLHMLDLMIKQYEVGLLDDQYENFEECMEVITERTFSFMEDTPEFMQCLLFFLSQAEHKNDYKKKLALLTKSALQSWLEKISTFFDTDISKEKLDNLIRIIDMYFAGLSMHYMVFEDKNKYSEISKDFFQMIYLFYKQEL